MTPDDGDVRGDDRWMAAMRRGDFASAWAISDDILARRIGERVTFWHLPRHLQHIWTGESLAGKRVLVRCYHGLGDTIQYLRFLAPLRALASEVILWVQPSLMPLAATAAGIDRIMPLHDGTPDAAYDVDIEIMEIPHALRITASEVTGRMPYLSPPPSNWQPDRNGLRSVGLVWRAGGWDARRSIPAARLRALAAVRSIRLYSLQLDVTPEEKLALPITDISTGDVAQAAARIAQLDLIISVDTMAAHLAGALARPVWTLLHSRSDWRWGETDGSVWYPTMRLFRQRHAGEWKPVIIDVMRAGQAHLMCRAS